MMPAPLRRFSTVRQNLPKAGENSLYERLGRRDGITRITADLMENHLANPLVNARYMNSEDLARVERRAQYRAFQLGTDQVHILSAGGQHGAIAQVAEVRCNGGGTVMTEPLEPMAAQMVGISLSVAEHAACYIPLAHDYAGAPDQLSREHVLGKLRPSRKACGNMHPDAYCPIDNRRYFQRSLSQTVRC